MIATYADLKTAIAEWLRKEGSASVVARTGDFIRLAEAEINGFLRTADMETRATAVTVAGNDYVAVPDLYKGGRRLVVTGENGRRLELVTPQFIDKRFLRGPLGKPRYFAIQDNQIRLGPTPDGEYTLEISYYKKITALSDVNPTNWLLDDWPNVYLFGSLKEAAAYIEKDGSLWEAKFTSAVDLLQRADRFDKQPGPLSMKHDYSTNDGRR